VSGKVILPRAEGKHVGHAVEGHCRGLFRRLLGRAGWEVLRELPFDFPVNPDVVVRGPDRLIRALVIVAYSRDDRGTDKKFYRTRLEYLEILRCWRLHEEAFSPDFTPLIVLYGADKGWKPELIRDLQAQCPPTIFLPAEVGAEACQRVVAAAYAAYASRRALSGADAREFVEEEFARLDPLPPLHQKVLAVFRRALERPAARQIRERLAPLVRPGRHPEPASWRIRQGLSLASLFAPEEVRAWLTPGNREPGACPQADAFVRRALFLDLVSLRRRRSLLHPAGRLEVVPRRPLRLEGRQQRYAPDRPDFAGWECVDADRAEQWLAAHRDLPRSNSRTFRAGAVDQIAGNWRGFCQAWHGRLGPIAEAVRARDPTAIAAALARETIITAEPWQPSAGQAGVAALWGACVAAKAAHDSDRKAFRHFGFRRGAPPEAARRGLAAALLDGADRVADLLDEVDDYCGRLLHRPFDALADAERPCLLSLDEPCSWTSAWYLRVVTNPSHTPLGHPVFAWLRRRFPEAAWSGWPAKRTERLREAFAGHSGRVEWQFIGREPSGRVVVAEVKSVTANNWGNKSKELYDRIAETRRAALAADAALTVVGVLDGDLDEQAVSEIASGRAYDETFTIGEVLGLEARPLR
jgi:hypothetical protein